jgi:group I intron endonuclease
MAASEYTLYKIDFPNGKIYIGYTSQKLEKRQADHKYAAKSNKKGRTPIQNALAKFSGQEKWEVLATCSSIEEAYAAEIELIEAYNSTDPKVGYNVSRGGDGIRHTAYTKAKIGKGAILTNKNRFTDKNNVEKQSKALKARWAIPGAKQELAIKKGAKPFYIIDVESGSVLGEFLSQRECARHFDVSPGFINNCLKGRRVGTKKYTFRYKDI